MSDLKTEQKKRNLRTALILGAIAAMFMFGVIAKRLWFI
nr:cytochrome oxidase small assembly protein [Janthinobacterium sp. Marseille]